LTSLEGRNSVRSVERIVRFRVIVPIVTPFDARGGVDATALEAHAATLAERGADAFFVGGTNGEGPLLDDDEVVAATRAVMRGAAGRRVIPQAGRPSTRASLRLLQRVLDAGADAAAAITPYFYAVEDEQLVEHYGRLIEASRPALLYAYSIPAYARNDLKPGPAATLAHAGLAGIKDSTKSIERHAAYVAVREHAPGFETFVGDDGLSLAALRLGSTGTVPALANVRPELFRALDEAAAAGDDARAEAVQEEIVQARAALRERGIATLKHAVAELMRGTGVTYDDAVRAPLPAHAPTGGDR
jgi:4-hydroxy-tetrahydrodipicolinate synthase